MDEQLVDDDLQLRIKIVSLFKSGGWKLYEERLHELKACFDSELAQILANEVNSEKLALLNMRLGQVRALSAVLAIQDELLEQIAPSDGDTSEEVSRE